MHAKSLLAVLALAAYPASALNISGFVLNKVGTPLPLAKVCLQTDASKCVTSGISGDFHISDGIGGALGVDAIWLGPLGVEGTGVIVRAMVRIEMGAARSQSHGGFPWLEQSARVEMVGGIQAAGQGYRGH